MSPFPRLRDGEGTELERQLLESGAEDVPSSGARARTLLAMGAAAGAAATVVMPGAAHAAASAATATGSAKAAGAMTSLMLAKWLGTGAAIGAVTAACIATVTTPGLLAPSQEEPSARAAAPVVPETSRATARSAKLSVVPNGAVQPPVAADTEGAPEGRVANDPSAFTAGRNLATNSVPVGAESVAAAPRGLAPLPSRSSTSVLAEVASLDRARSALASGDAQTALARLTEHQRQFPGGALEPEAVVLQARALVQLGRRAEATALVNGFLAAHPDSSQGVRLRTVVGAAPR